jgi:hypothetical protein
MPYEIGSLLICIVIALLLWGIAHWAGGDRRG